MKGYKATINMECKGFEYEVGKTYELEGELVICDNGFHFCKNQQDVLRYYGYCQGFILLEVEALGKVITDGDKSVTDKIRILRVVPREEWEFLEEGHVIHYKESRTERWETYDENFNQIHYKDSLGYEEWREYDVTGNDIHYKNSEGHEEWIVYNNDGGKTVHVKRGGGYEQWLWYDKFGILIKSSVKVDGESISVPID